MRNIRIITCVVKYPIFLLVLLFLDVQNVQGQNSEASYEMFKKHRKSNLDSALYYAQLGIEQSLQENDSLLLAKFYMSTGWVKRETGNHQSAIEDFLVSYEISLRKNDIESQKYLLNFLGITYTMVGNYDAALKYHLKSLEIREKEGNENEIARTRNNLGVVYYDLQHFKVALQHFTHAYKYWKSIKDDTEVQRTAINIGLCYIEMGAYDEALVYFTEVRDKTKIESHLQMQLYSGLGIVNFNKENWSLSWENFDKAESIASDLQSNLQLATSLHYKAMIKREQKDLLSARDHIKKSLSYSSQIPRWLNVNYRVAALIEEELGNFNESVNYYKKHINLQDSLLNESVIEEVQNLRLAYEEQKHQKNLSSLDMRLAQNQKINILLISLLISVCFIAFFSYRASKVRKDAVKKIGHAYQLVERQKDQLEKMVAERTLDLRNTNEELANFIYRTSHDIRGPLATLKGVCNVALLDVQDKGAIEYLKKIDTTSSKLINILSRIQNINSIKNYVIQDEDIDLKKMIDSILNDTDKHEDISVYNSVPSKITITTDSSMLKICLSNVIGNAFKFRKRGNNHERPYVKIVYTDSGSVDKIQIIDNGAGIQPEHVNKIFNLFFKNDPSGSNPDSAGIGLHLAKLAINKVGGDVNVNSVPGENTCFTITIPKKINVDDSVIAEQLQIKELDNPIA